MATPATAQEIRFGEHSLDVRTGELRRNGTVLKLQPQPAKILAILLARAGEIVTRQELAEQVWGSGTYVDFEHGLNYAIQQIRSVLEDDPKDPHFLETVPRRGYRFVAPVRPAEREQQPPAPEAPALAGSTITRIRHRHLAIAAVATVAVLAVAVWLYVRDREVRTAPGARIQSVAVLPLRNLSNDPEQEYFSDGMTDELITDLANAGGLRVISHTSVERYKGTKLSLPQIARDLRVDAIVEGTVMRSDGKVRITAQLIDARTDQHLWAASYERDLRDILRLQDDVAQRIAAEIGTNILGLRPHPNIPSVDPVAHEAYLRGLFYWSQLTCGSYSKGQQYFQEAVDRAPNFAPAYVGLAQSYFALSDGGCSSDRDLGRQAKSATLKAIDLDPDSAEAHAWLGKIAFYYEWDLPLAEKEFRKAIALGPNYATAHFLFGVFLITTERRQLGVAEIRKALELDPVSHVTNAVSTFALYLAREYDPAIDQGKRSIDLYPSSATTYDWLGASYEQKSSYDQAATAYLKARELRGASANELNYFRTAYRKAGIHGYWRKELEAVSSRPSNACSIAAIYAHLGNKEETLKFLKRGFSQGCVEPHILLADPIYDEVRQDPTCRELIRSRLPAK